MHTPTGASGPPLRQPAKSEHNFLRGATSSGGMIHSRALTEAGRAHNRWMGIHRTTPQLCPTRCHVGGLQTLTTALQSRRVPTCYQGEWRPLRGAPSLATGWSSSIGNLLNRNIIPCVEPRACGATVHNRASTEYMGENVTFGFVGTSDTRDIGRADALTPYPGGRCDRSFPTCTANPWS